MSKYRVWDIPEQKMQYEGFWIEPDGTLGWRNDAKPEPDTYILMQSIGKKDKNNKEIYTDDELDGGHDCIIGGIVFQDDDGQFC